MQVAVQAIAVDTPEDGGAGQSLAMGQLHDGRVQRLASVPQRLVHDDAQP
jgi:hypothetical protein